MIEVTTYNVSGDTDGILYSTLQDLPILNIIIIIQDLQDIIMWILNRGGVYEIPEQSRVVKRSR